MFDSIHRCRTYILLFFAFCLIGSLQAGEDFSRTRHKAALLALLCYNPVNRMQKDFSCQRAQLVGLCNTLVQEGGYVSKRAENILDITDPEVEHVAMLVRELSGDISKVSRPGPMLLASAIALGYARPEVSGLRASMHVGRLNSADPQTDAVMRSVYSLLTNILEGGFDNKTDLIKVAAVNADDNEVAKELRSLKLIEWRKLPDEKTLLGRLCRSLYIWQHTKNWEEAMQMGQRKLHYFESMRFLAVVCAAWGDMHGMPENFVWQSVQDNQIRQICIHMHELANTGVLIYIPKSLVEKQLSASRSYSRESVDGYPIDNSETTGSTHEIINPIPPTAPVAPTAPTAPATMPIVFSETTIIQPASPSHRAPVAPIAPQTPAEIVITDRQALMENATYKTPKHPETPQTPVTPVLAPVDEFSSFALPSK